MNSELPSGYYIGGHGYAGLRLPVDWFANLAPRIMLDGVEYSLKDEFHVTIINARGVAKIIAENTNIPAEEIENEIHTMLGEYLTHTPMQFLHFVDDVRLAIKNERKSLAIRCELSNLEPFFNTLREKFQRVIELQPVHVSLYTLTGLAVGIDSIVQMESYEQVLIPEITQALVQ